MGRLLRLLTFLRLIGTSGGKERMATKIFQKFFENFKGLDLSSSALTRPLNFASILKNYEIKRPFSLQSRKGIKPITQAYEPSGGSGSTDEEVFYPTAGICTYVYAENDPVNSITQTKQELVGVGYGLYKLAPGTLGITYTGAGVARFSFYPTQGNWIANLTVDGVAQAGFPASCGSGSYGDFTLEGLRQFINAIPNFTAVLTPWAVVNGAQVGVGTITTPITVDAGHTITVSTTVPTRIEIHRNGNPEPRICRDVVAQTATTITLNAPPGRTTFNVADNQVIGVGLYECTVLPIIPPDSADSLLSATQKVYSFEYWERVCFPYLTTLGSLGRVGAGFAEAPLPDTTNCSFVNKDNVLYVAAPIVSDNNDFIALNSIRFSLRPYSALLKYDGLEFYGCDLPIGRFILNLAAGAGLDIGRYQYLVTYQQIDAKGNIVESADNRSSYDSLGEQLAVDPTVYQVASVVTTAGNQQVDVTVTTVQSNAAVTNSSLYRNHLSAFAANAGTQVYAISAGTVFTVDPGHSLRVGNTAAWTNAVDGKIQRGKVTALTATTITIVTDRAGSIADNEAFSNNLTIRIYRTKVGGNVFYLHSERPNPSGPPGSVVNFIDSTADALLTEIYDDPGELVRENPPVLRHITSHQGVLVGWGDPGAPQTVYWSNPGENESWTAGRNELSLGNLSVDPVRACASDTETMLAAFTDTGYFNIAGDLSEGLFSISAVAGSDVGCVSPHSVRKIRDYLFYLSQKGYRAIRSGTLVNIEDRLVSVFQNNFYEQVKDQPIITANQAKLYLLRANSVIDTENQRYVCFVPAESSSTVFGGAEIFQPNNNSRVFVYDYAKDCWTEWTFSEGAARINSAGGITTYKNRHYFNSVMFQNATVDLNVGRLWALNNSDTNYDWMDGTYTIPRTFRPQWDAMDEPSVDAVYQDLKIYMLDNEDNTAGVVFTVKTYRNFNSAALDTDMTISFAVAQTEAAKRLKLNKARAIEFEFSNSTAYVNPVITGYEYVVAIPYKKDSAIL